MRRAKIIVGLLVFIASSACGAHQMSQPVVTPGAAKMSLKKGVTTQAEVLQMVGSPSFVTTAKGGELWAYSNDARVNSAYGLGLLALGGGVAGSALGGGAVSGSYNSSTSSSRTINLLITFDEMDVIKDYTVSQLQY